MGNLALILADQGMIYGFCDLDVLNRNTCQVCDGDLFYFLSWF